MVKTTNALKHLHWQWAFLSVFLTICILLFCLTMDYAVAGTISLVGLVSTVGLFLISNLSVALGDKRLQLIGYVWLAKLFLTLFLVYFTWIPELSLYGLLDPAFDPIRYYYQSQDLIDQHWDPSMIPISYSGILIYFGGFFYIFGWNPVNPAYLNAFTTLLATLLLIVVGYEIAMPRNSKGWILGLAMILPEILFYDILTSRESVVMALITIVLLLISRFWLSVNSTSRLCAGLVVILFSLGLAAIRTSLIAPIILAIAFMALFYKSPARRGLSRKLPLILFIGFAISIPIFAVSLGYDFFSFSTMFENVLGVNRQLEGEIVFTKNSISQLLIPTNSIEAVIFILPRLILYIVAPIPTIQFELFGLMSGKFADWLMLTVTTSALLNVVFFPWTVSSLINCLKNRSAKWRELAFHIPYWSLMISIAAGNQILHERYRVITTIFFWGCVWLGITTCPKSLIKKVAIAWILFLGFSGVGFVIYKFNF